MAHVTCIGNRFYGKCYLILNTLCELCEKQISMASENTTGYIVGWTYTGTVRFIKLCFPSPVIIA